MTLRISMDLDNTVFDLNQMIRDVCAQHGFAYRDMQTYDIYSEYPKGEADKLMDAFCSPIARETPLLSSKIPDILNKLNADPNIMLYYITERDTENSEHDMAQLRNAGIMCDTSRIIHTRPKIEALRRYNIDLCIDDSPNVVRDCLDNGIDVVMISNDDTTYNHSMRPHVRYYPTLVDALRGYGLIK